MHKYLVDKLVCPACRGKLEWDLVESDQYRIQRAEVGCSSCSAIYRVRDEIGLFLTPGLPGSDKWEQVEVELSRYFQEHPNIFQKLMDSDLDCLSPADSLFRSYLLEMEGSCLASRLLERNANQGLYTADYLSCWDRQMDYVIKCLSGTSEPVVDFASGRCYLVEKMARELDCPIVASDVSPGLMRRNRTYLQQIGRYEQVSLLVFDARQTPFRTGSIDVLTTNLGLANIPDPELALPELRRVVSGSMLAVTHFYHEDDRKNADAIKQLGLNRIFYRSMALKLCAEAGWSVKIRNCCEGAAHPTPAGNIIPGVKIDTLPVEKTWLEWCVLVGRDRTYNVSAESGFSEKHFQQGR